MPKRRKWKKESFKKGVPERFPGRPENPSERWHRLYSEIARFRHAFSPAYNKGVSPLIAGIIGYQKKPRVKVLVLAGGTGFFSKSLLPAVKTELTKMDSNATIEVFETDISESVAKAPGTAHRARADIHRLPFRAESFDLIVGQSMIHQGRLGESIPEIKRVMKPDGFFVHIQDTIPDPRSFIPGFGERSILRAETHVERAIIGGVSMQSHSALLMQVNAHARQNGLNSAAVSVSGQAFVSTGHRFGRVGGKDLDAGNAVYYHMGVVSVGKEQGIPRNKKKLSYTGMATIISKQLVGPLVNHLQQIYK